MMLSLSNPSPDGCQDCMTVRLGRGPRAYVGRVPCPACSAAVIAARAQAARRNDGRASEALSERVGVPRGFLNCSIAVGGRCQSAIGVKVSSELLGRDVYYVPTKRMLEVLKALREFTAPGGVAVLHGAKDAGKSHLAAGWMLDLARRGESCCWISLRGLDRLLQTGFRSELYAQGQQLINRACVAQYVVLDHLDPLPGRALEEGLEWILAERYEHRRTTLITTLERHLQLKAEEIGHLVDRGVQLGGGRYLIDPVGVK